MTNNKEVLNTNNVELEEILSSLDNIKTLNLVDEEVAKYNTLLDNAISKLNEQLE